MQWPSLVPRDVAMLWILLYASQSWVHASSMDSVLTARTCTSWMQDLSQDEYQSLVSLNCDPKVGRVARATAEFDRAKSKARVTDRQIADWDSRVKVAHAECQAALGSSNVTQAAYDAVEAFGTGIMQNSLCCSRLSAPFCTIPAHMDNKFAFRSPAGVLLCSGMALMLVMAVSTAIDSCMKRRQADERGKDEVVPDEPPRSSGVEGPLMDATSLTLELQSDWLRSSCLRKMPGARRMAASSASLFGSLFSVFEFQQDNVRNQYEHLLSLWRSHIASVADRRLDRVDEQYLLADALDDLHCELMEGFLRWREQFQGYESAGIPQPSTSVPPVGGASWEPVPLALCPTRSPEEAAERSRQLVEVAVYLLVWGEAGNIRFMPEVVYFITELALSSSGPGGPGFYGAAEPVAPGGRSGRFLARVIRPLYSLVFDEWYEKVDINDKGGDKKVLLRGFERFLLPDVANYDDWNEFFCDPSQVVEGIILWNGQGLFDQDHGARYAALPHVHWRASLKGSQIKTHRECHSMLGMFASTHRVWFLHALLFFTAIILVTGDAELVASTHLSVVQRPSMGQALLVRLAAVGLLVPIHAMLWALARLETTSNNILTRACNLLFCLQSACWGILWLAPLGTFAYVRMCVDHELTEPSEAAKLKLHIALGVHLVVSAAGVFFLLFAPAKKADRLFRLTPVPLHLRIVRYLFWSCILAVKFLLALWIFLAIWNATKSLQFINVGRESPEDILSLWRNSNWSANFYEWLMLWLTAWWLFISDTAMWFQVGCMFLGVGIVFVQRGCRCFQFAFEDALQKIPVRMSQLVFPYSQMMRGKEISEYFPSLWDRVVAYMRYEDKCESDGMGEMSFARGHGAGLTWEKLSLTRKPLEATRDISTMPDLFVETTVPEVCFRNYFGWSRSLANADLKWRLYALSRGLGLPIPRPYRAPYIPGITVMIPHYGETIIMSKGELFDRGSSEQSRRSHVQVGRMCKVPVREMVPLIDWLKARYVDEYRAFTHRMEARGMHIGGVPWEEMEDHHWDKICVWASMRMQTLWRTVAGICLYHPALQVHYDTQKISSSCLAQADIWNPADCFTCLVSMQIYNSFDKAKLSQTNKMFNKFPESLKVAYIDHEDLYPRSDDAASARRREEAEQQASLDHVHPRQARRYWSCLIDKKCPLQPDLRRTPRYRIELPGFPILGDGKSDNQNHAIPFMRGHFAQCIDANQGAYFEQMLFLPCALGEFRSRYRGDPQAKRIVGFPEHITSDIGSIGDFAASAEVAFGTILQRTYAALGARMHYGHPDIMNKVFMMQQGGVSKATKTLNLSEDIFAGMDFTLRGQGRTIHHQEYFHLAKGRDLGFNTVLGFFSKLASGTGEQVITRQAFRLGQILHLPEALTFYYAHVGYYFTQYLVSMSLPLLVFVWLLVIFSDCEGSFDAFLSCGSSGRSAAETMAGLLGIWFSWLLLLFLIASSLPLFVEVWSERSFKTALVRFGKQLCTLSPLLFIFQGKIIGHYVTNELRYGGATYVSTGRGLPTERRPFVGEAHGKGLKLKKVGGLYLDYAAITYYDGAMLLAGTVLIAFVGGAGAAQSQLNWIFVSLSLVIVSWLFAPFIFNPYQFEATRFWEDLRCLTAFFMEDGGRHWVEWYNRTQLRKGSGRSVVDIVFFLGAFFIVAWYAMMNVKIQALGQIFAAYSKDQLFELNVLMLMPPFICSMAYCVVAMALERIMGCYGAIRRLRRRPRRSGAAFLDLEAGAPGVADGAEVEEAEAREVHVAERDRAVKPAADPQGAGGESGCRCCLFGMPLAISAVCVLLLDIVEAAVALYRFTHVGWWRAFVAGLMLKWGISCLLLHLGEGVLRSQVFERCGRFGLVLDLWVRAHRMARDILTSVLILVALTPLVLINMLNDYLTPGLSLHHLLIYRNPNHLGKREAIVHACQWDVPEQPGAPQPKA